MTVLQYVTSMFSNISLLLCNSGKLLIPLNIYYKKIIFRQLTNMLRSEQCFKGQLNRYNAIIVKSIEESCELAVFSKRLKASLDQWVASKITAVWFEVHEKHVDWVPVLIKENFKYHHAKNENLTLYKWLCEDQPCNIPHYAHTNIGVGAFVYNKNTEELLVVKEKQSNHNMWKLPGGYMEPNEDINEAVEREVLEETGIKSQFKCILGFRHTHHHAFGCSDVYIVAHLTPLTFNVKKCSQEISECIWMKLTDYVKHPEVHDNNKFAAKKMVEHLKTGIGIEATHAIHPISKNPIVVYTINNNIN